MDSLQVVLKMFFIFGLKRRHDMKIPFNKPNLIGKETHYIYRAVYSEHKISGNGLFTHKCHEFFEQRYGFKKCLLTTSCTDALEMSAILTDIQLGDEVILPSYTFVSTANAFILRGARLVFADSNESNPNIDANKIEDLITSKTKVIIPVHYAGIACDMDKIMSIAEKHNLFVVEDAAQSIDSYYLPREISKMNDNQFNDRSTISRGKNKPLGSIGHLGAFSFHETKNIISGEGGMLVINDPQFEKRAEIIWEKGTNRAAFFRGEIDKYGWVDIGSSFLPSELVSAFLYAQLESLEEIQKKRLSIWNQYYEGLNPLEEKEYIKLPKIPDYATNNGHIFYIICKSLEERTALIKHLKENNILSAFHYLSLHKSPFYKDKHDGRELPNSDMYENCLLRLPMYYELEKNDVQFILKNINKFYN